MSERRVSSTVCYTLGVCGAIACSVAMFAIPLGIVGVGVAAGAKTDSMQNMAGMSGTLTAAGAASNVPGWIVLLNRFGSELLIVSIALVIIGLVMRRSTFGALAALIGGVILFYGMYGQANLSVMWVATAAGLAILLSSMLGLRRRLASP